MRRQMLKGKITIGRRTSNLEPDYMWIQIEDSLSGIQVIEAKIDLQSFTEALTGIARTGCLFDIGNYDRLQSVGRKRQVREVFLDGYFKNLDEENEEIKKAVGPHLTDGWMVWDYGLTTQQNSPNKHRIVLYRYVDAA